MIYTDGSRLPGPDAVDLDSPVLVSDVVRFDTEVRLHVLDKTVVAASRYAQSGQRNLGPAPRDAITFGADVLTAVGDTLSSAIVIDIGIVDGAWTVVEANAAWASGCYTADPAVILEIILRAPGPASTVGGHDQQFLRLAPRSTTTSYTSGSHDRDTHQHPHMPRAARLIRLNGPLETCAHVQMSGRQKRGAGDREAVWLERLAVARVS